jgi:hypothetical protein
MDKTQSIDAMAMFFAGFIIGYIFSRVTELLDLLILKIRHVFHA